MTIPTILTVLGILATVLFGIWAVVIRRRYPGEITFVVEDCIGLFDTIVKNFPELAVIYQEKPISHGLVLLKGTFLNSGKKDITPEMVEDQITLNLPEDFKWLAAKTVGASRNVNASVETEPNSLRFSTSLFRCQEYFKFEVLAEVPVLDNDNSINKKLTTNISPSHRIADTGKIRKVSLPAESYTKRRLLWRIMVPASLMIVLGVIMCSVVFFRGLPVVMLFQVPQQDGSVAEVTVKPYRNGTIRIKDKAHDIDEKVKAESFFSRSDISPKIIQDPLGKYAIIITLFIYIISPIVIISIILGGQRKWRRLRKRIGLN